MTNKYSLIWLILMISGIMGITACTGTKKVVKETVSKVDDALTQLLSEKIPVDPAVKMGKLDNGMRYYIQQNNLPENRVELRLVLNAGSLQESDEQQGLAHFVEHMCFNGTKNFAKNEIVDFFETSGMLFGAHANAYTSFDETVYMLQLPTDSAELLNTGFQVLEDWAHYVSFEEEEIDKERGVVIEEWRLRRNPEQRMRDKYKDVLFTDSRYADRMPIGKVDIIKNFKYETLRQFYKDWYRPDLMAIIVVGDIDVAEIEAKVKKQFGAIKNPADAPKRVNYPVGDNKEPLIAVETDPEASFARIRMFYKHPLHTNKTIADYRNALAVDLYNGMLNSRLEEQAQNPKAPFIGAFSQYGALTRSKDAYISFATTADDGIEKGLAGLVRENERVLRHGFVQSELDRQKMVMIKSLETALKEKDKTESASIARKYTGHFLSKDPIPSIEFQNKTAKRLLENITLKDLNALPKKFLTDENLCIIVTGPEKENLNYPSKERLLEIYKNTKAENIEAYTEEAVALTLMDSTPKSGSIKEEKKNEELGLTELTLSNGVKVVLRPTDFKNDQVLMNALSWGGNSLYPDSDFNNVEFTAEVIAESGVGNFNRINLEKTLAGKKIRLQPFISTYSEGMNGSTSPDDMEMFMQLIHLYFTQARKDEDAFNALQAQQSALVKNLMGNPQYYFANQVSRIKANNHFRADDYPTVEEVQSLKQDRIMEIYKERFGDADEFTFFFVGNFDVEGIKPLLATYLGSLPTIDNKAEKWKDIGLKMPAGKTIKKLNKGSDPKSFVSLTYHGEMEYNEQSRYELLSLAEVMRIKLREVLREDKGGVYGVGVGARPDRLPEGNYEVNISFGCDPANVDELIKATQQVVSDLQSKPLTGDYLQKVRETQKRTYETGLRENRYWLSKLSTAYRYGDDAAAAILKVGERINGLDEKAIQNAAKKYLNQNSYIQIVLDPEK